MVSAETPRAERGGMGRALALQGQTVPSPGWEARAGSATSQPSALCTSRDMLESGGKLCLHISTRRLPLGSLICLRQPLGWCSPSTSPPFSFCFKARGGSCCLTTAAADRACLQPQGQQDSLSQSWLRYTTFLPPFYSNLDAWAGIWWFSST